MDQPTPAPAAPAQPAVAEPPAPTATQAALANHDFGAFQAAKRIAPAAPEKKGVVDTLVDAVIEDRTGAPAPPREVSKRQQETNDRIRAAVDAATADLRAELARLKGAPAAPRSEIPPTPPAAPEKKEPEYKRFAAMPDAPKLAEFESIEEYSAAMGLFIADKRHDERTAVDSQRREHETRDKGLQAQSERYKGHLAKAKAADPDFLAKIPPAIVHATPLSGCRPDGQGRLIDPSTNQPTTFANVVAEAAFRSDNPVALLNHLHAHPEDATRIGQLDPSEWVASLLRLDGRLAERAQPPAPPVVPVTEGSAAPSTITAAPPPPETLSRPSTVTDPLQDALKRHDEGAFLAIKRAQRRAAMTA